MDLFQQTSSVIGVLILLGATLYWLRGRGMAKIGTLTRSGSVGKRLQSIERLPLTPQHSLHLVRVGGRVVLIAVSPGGCAALDGSWELPEEQAAIR